MTPHLEQLIFEGRAASRTWQTGGSGVGRIPVTKNHYAVLLGFTFMPFIDAATMNDINDYATTVRVKLVHQVKLYTKSKSHYFCFREWFTPFSEFDTGNNSVQIAPGQPFYQPCYLIFDERIRVNIRCLINSGPDSWVNTDYSALPDTSEELAAPMNYGTASTGGTSVLRNFQMAGPGIDTAVEPVGDESPSPLISRADSNEQFVTKNNAALLADPTGFVALAQNGMNYPIINFQYVEIFEALPDKLRPTLI